MCEMTVNTQLKLGRIVRLKNVHLCEITWFYVLIYEWLQLKTQPNFTFTEKLVFLFKKVQIANLLTKRLFVDYVVMTTGYSDVVCATSTQDSGRSLCRIIPNCAGGMSSQHNHWPVGHPPSVHIPVLGQELSQFYH